MRLVGRAALFVFALISLTAWAQDSAPLSQPQWNVGVFTQGGTGVSDRSDVKILAPIGFRFGRVFTGPIFKGALRSSFEWNAEVLPYQKYYSVDGKDIHSFAANPFIVKWHFIGEKPRKLAPFFIIHGGLVKSSGDLPPGNTSDINFTSGGGLGFNYFVRPRQAVTFDFRAVHLSNASLGDHNPGINASLLFSVGYTWFKK